MSAAVRQEDSAAHSLLGRELEGGWRVVEKLERAPDATGSNFSVGYIVERDGQRAFLKALDYSRALNEPDFTRVLQGMTEAFNFERDILDRCRAGRMDRIVLALAHGELMIETARIPQVSYLIFEEADGDVRKALSSEERDVDPVWKLRMLHHTTTGLWQMHKNGMAHQDVKPSNVLIFNGDSAKVADLGRASEKNVAAPHDNFPFPGDPAYKPLEFFYGQISPDWNERRQASDLYMLGSLALFLFGGTHMTAAVGARLQDSVQPGTWTGTYAEAMPYIRVAFDDVVEELDTLLRGDLSDDVRDGVVTITRRLCDPDPALRGHPRSHAMKHGNPYSLERFMAEFDLLALRAQTRRV